MIALTESIFVFKTNIDTPAHWESIKNAIESTFEIESCSIDLEDVDKVMRVIATDIDPIHIISLVEKQGKTCYELV